MKKLMMLLAFAGLTSAASAQETSYPTLKHQFVSNPFWSNWFVDAGVTHLSFYSDQEHKMGMNKNPFWSGRRSWGGEISVGKWATPLFGVRAKIQAAWGTRVCDYSYTGYNTNCPTFNQWSMSFQPMINLTNLIGGYKPRFYNISLYGGAGFLCNLGVEGENTDNQYGMQYCIGFMNTFNINERYHVNLDIYATAGEDDLDGLATNRGLKPRVFKSRDLELGLSVGVGVNLGKIGWDNAPDIDAIMAMNQAQLDALNASLADAEAENARLKALIANHKCPEGKTVTITEYATTSASVFFNINQTKIASKKDLVNVKELAELAKSKNAKLVVTGYADSKTGSVARNQTLSEGRAKTVVDELVKMGVNRDNIEIVAKGGVADLEPYNYNRRAVVTLK
ncbi:MAG: OmpA family protein [Bacteroidaceae bacterium]|nr:OmpA family protein [Bacteroidaceae bacterium]